MAKTTYYFLDAAGNWGSAYRPIAGTTGFTTDVERPSLNHTPSFTDDVVSDANFIEWVYQFSAEQVAVYRDSKILDVELTVDMPDESQVVIVNNTRTIAAIDSKMRAMQNNSLITSRSFEFVNGSRDTTYEDFQQITVTREAFEQKAFDAYDVILANHQTTPYTTEQSWKDDFNTEWEA